MSTSIDGSVNGKCDGRKRTGRSGTAKKARQKSVMQPLRCPMWMSVSTASPSTWWNIGVWVASESLR